MSNTITIPPTIEEVKQRALGLEALYRATEWERAAIVTAFTDDSSVGGRGKRLCSETVYGVREFAELKLPGLSSTNTVQRYRDAWRDAVEMRLAQPVEPGSTVVLPEGPFPARDQHIGRLERTKPAVADQVRTAAKEFGVAADSIAHTLESPTTMKAAVTADPAFRAVVREAIQKIDWAEFEDRHPIVERDAEPSAMTTFLRLQIHLRAITDNARWAIQRAQEAGQGHGGIGDDARDVLLARVRRARDVLDAIETSLEGHELTDEALHEWMDTAP